jgi:hypothetical protein
MNFSKTKRSFLIMSLVLVGQTGFAPRAANAAEAYAGAMLGLGIPMGTAVDVDSGTVWGATLGLRLLPMLSVAGTYLHDGLETAVGGADFTTNQWLLEGNFFDLLFMNAGVHVGSVSTEIAAAKSTDLGYGFHVGFDFRLTEQVSLGAAGYWTYVTADDKYATLNLMVPLKIWF